MDGFCAEIEAILAVLVSKVTVLEAALAEARANSTSHGAKVPALDAPVNNMSELIVTIRSNAVHMIPNMQSVFLSVSSA